MTDTLTPTRPPLWTRFFILMSVANFCVAVIFYLLTSTLTAWAIGTLGASAPLAGLAGTAWFIGAMAARLLTGGVLSRFGERLAVVGSLAGMFSGTLLYPFVHAIGWLLVLRFVHGMTYGVASSAMAGAALSRVPVNRHGEGSGYFSFGLAVATGMAPFMGIQIQHSSLGQRGVFLVGITSAAIALACVLAAARTLDSSPHAPLANHNEAKWLDTFVERPVLPIALVVGLCALPFGAVLTLLSSFAATTGLTHAAGYYFLVYAAVICVSRPMAGILQDRRNDTSVILPVMGFLLLGIVLTALATNGPELLLGAASLGLGYGTLVPAGQTVALNLAQPGRAGVSISSYFLLVDLGTGLGPFVIGALTTHLGQRGALLSGTTFAITGIIAMVGYLTQTRRQHFRPTAARTTHQMQHKCSKLRD